MTSRILYLPSVNQLQVTVKFNQSTLRYFLDYYKMVPVDKEPFRLSLTDENGNIVSEQYSMIKDHYALYRYYRITFYNVDVLIGKYSIGRIRKFIITSSKHN